MNIQAIFSDIDGTLINSQHQITPRTLKAIRQVLELNIPFILVSARPPRAITPYIHEIGSPQIFIAFNGALILDTDGKALHSLTLTGEDLVRLENILENRAGVFPNYYHGLEWYSSDPSNYWTTQEGEITHLRASLKPKRLTHVHKILVMGEPNDIIGLETELKALFPHLHIHRSKPTYLEIVHREASKSQAIDFLAKRFGIHSKQIMVFGDNYNDLDMLHYAGYAVVMGNAPEEIKAQFSHITADNHHDGVALILEKEFNLPQL